MSPCRVALSALLLFVAAAGAGLSSAAEPPPRVTIAEIRGVYGGA